MRRKRNIYNDIFVLFRLLKYITSNTQSNITFTKLTMSQNTILFFFMMRVYLLIDQSFSK